MTEFDKDCLEKIPPDELRSIHDRVDEMLRKAADMNPSPFSHYTWCDHCPGDSAYKRAHLPKQPCICRPYEGDAICARCWAKEQEEKLCREYLESLDRLNKPKEPFPVAELKYGGLTPVDTQLTVQDGFLVEKPVHRIPLDLADFCRI